MKSQRRFVLLILICVEGILRCSLPAEEQQQPDRYSVQEFPVGNSPVNFTFDGTNIWVANSGDNTVTKLRASDGELEGTFPVGNYPQSLAFDGSNIWSADLFGGTITKLRASDGSLLATFPGFTFPSAILFDGSSIWFCNDG